MNALLSIPEADLDPVPAFYVEAPDGRKDWTELQRQTAFLKLMRYGAPRVAIYANANAGKRNPQQAIREGIKSGVFDLIAIWRGPLVAYLEFKGFDKNGRPGRLSRNQIEFGNRMVELGVPAACFFSPYAAAAWLREQGFPVSKGIG